MNIPYVDVHYIPLLSQQKKTWKSDKNPMKIHQVDTPPI